MPSNIQLMLRHTVFLRRPVDHVGHKTNQTQGMCRENHRFRLNQLDKSYPCVTAPPADRHIRVPLIPPIPRNFANAMPPF